MIQSSGLRRQTTSAPASMLSSTLRRCAGTCESALRPFALANSASLRGGSRSNSAIAPARAIETAPIRIVTW